MPAPKEPSVRHTLSISIIALLATALLSSCLGDQKTVEDSGDSSAATHVARRTVPSGASIEVKINTTLF
jgi:hypothetical protein